MTAAVAAAGEFSAETLLHKTLQDIDAGIAPRTAQNHAEASYVTMLDKSMCPIDWNKTPREVNKWICGLQPWPVATAEIDGATGISKFLT